MASLLRIAVGAAETELVATSAGEDMESDSDVHWNTELTPCEDEGDVMFSMLIAMPHNYPFRSFNELCNNRLKTNLTFYFRM